MKNSKRSLRMLLALSATLILVGSLTPAFAQGGAAPAERGSAAIGGVARLEYLGAGLGAGMVVIGAGIGIGRFAAAAAEGVARQPQAAAQITGAVNLPLFLLEGVAIIGEVVCLLLALKPLVPTL